MLCITAIVEWLLFGDKYRLESPRILKHSRGSLEKKNLFLTRRRLDMLRHFGME